MYNTLLFLHSWLRWAVLLSLVPSVVIATIGYYNQLPFTKAHNALRHWTATIAHIQLMAGILVYTQSPIIKYYWGHKSEAATDNMFFAVIHIALMLAAITVITIGSAKAKRKDTSGDKFKTVLHWYALALTLILIAIPWPFSPLAVRPLIR